MVGSKQRITLVFAATPLCSIDKRDKDWWWWSHNNVSKWTETAILIVLVYYKADQSSHGHHVIKMLFLLTII